MEEVDLRWLQGRHELKEEDSRREGVQESELEVGLAPMHDHLGLDGPDRRHHHHIHPLLPE